MNQPFLLVRTDYIHYVNPKRLGIIHHKLAHMQQLGVKIQHDFAKLATILREIFEGTGEGFDEERMITFQNTVNRAECVRLVYQFQSFCNSIGVRWGRRLNFRIPATNEPYKDFYKHYINQLVEIVNEMGRLREQLEMFKAELLAYRRTARLVRKITGVKIQVVAVHHPHPTVDLYTLPIHLSFPSAEERSYKLVDPTLPKRN